MSATAAFFAVRAPVRVSVAQVRPRVPPVPRAPRRSALSIRGSTRRAAVRARASLTAARPSSSPRNPRRSDAQALDRVPRGRQGDLRQGGGLQVPARVRRLQG
jgi:hypothetical protein